MRRGGGDYMKIKESFGVISGNFEDGISSNDCPPNEECSQCTDCDCVDCPEEPEE